MEVAMRSRSLAIIGVVLLLCTIGTEAHALDSDPEASSETEEFAEDHCPDLSELPTEEERQALRSVYCQVIDDANPFQDPPVTQLVPLAFIEMALGLRLQLLPWAAPAL